MFNTVPSFSFPPLCALDGESLGLTSRGWSDLHAVGSQLPGSGFFKKLPQMCNDLLVTKYKSIIDSGQFLNQQNHSWGRLKTCSSTAKLATTKSAKRGCNRGRWCTLAVLGFAGKHHETWHDRRHSVAELGKAGQALGDWKWLFLEWWQLQSRKSCKTHTNWLAECKRTSMRVNNRTTWVSSYKLE